MDLKMEEVLLSGIGRGKDFFSFQGVFSWVGKKGGFPLFLPFLPFS